MREDFLHYLWRMRLFDASHLQTTDGQTLEVLHPGAPNLHGGPDFLDARLRLDGTLWAGNVELHLRSSDWRRHRHQEDPAYGNVILHVVLEEDEPAFLPGGQPLPCLELKRRIPPRLQHTYLRLLNAAHWVPCQPFLPDIPQSMVRLWLDRCLVERLERKAEPIVQTLETTRGHWEETFYRFLARNFGLRTNAQPFEMLARSLPLTVLGRHHDSLFQLEALLFGQAGLLQGPFREAYPERLRTEYRFLQEKYELTPLDAGLWRFLRMRPANFPTLRIAQFARLLHRSVHLFRRVLEAPDVPSLERLFEVRLDGYWAEHYRFDKPAPVRSRKLGRAAVHLLLINTVAPFLFLYGRRQGAETQCEQAFRILEALPAENNRILRGWKNLGITAENAYLSQALIQLKENYCDERRCVHCAIGDRILRKPQKEPS